MRQCAQKFSTGTGYFEKDRNFIVSNTTITEHSEQFVFFDSEFSYIL